MTAEALLVAFLSAVGWAAFDFARKDLARTLRPVTILAWVTAAQGLAFALIWLLAGTRGPSPAYWPPGAAVLLLNLGANLLFVRALQISPISRTVPLLSLTPVFTAIGGEVLLDESLSLLRWAGIALVVVGALLLNAPPRAEGGARRFVEGILREPGARLVLLVALFWGLNAPFDKLSVKASSVPFHAFLQGAGLALVFGGWLLARGRRAEFRLPLRHGRALGLALVAGPLAIALQLLAFTMADVAAVETLKRVVGMGSALLFGRLLLGEAVGPRQVFAVALMALGLPLVLSD